MKFRTLVLACSITAISTLTGCAAVGNVVGDTGAYTTGTDVKPEQMALIVDKTSKKADVIGKIGQPNRKAQVGTTEIWYYDFTKITHFSGNVNESTVFEFNKNGVVQAHYKTNKTGGSNNALLNAAGK